MPKMWAGRFQKEEDEQVNDFNSSISFDCRLYEEDITGSIAHAKMLASTGIIPVDDAEKIIDGLNGILADLKSGTLAIDSTAEDIHMFVEATLTERIGSAGKRLHTARSRNDQVALDMHMYVKKSILDVIGKTKDLIKVLIKLSEDNVDTVMSGYTHLQRAQPVSMAHYFCAYANMLFRDISRLKSCYERADVMPLGSTALAGTTYPINRHMVAETLGFSKVGTNSLDDVSDRDFVIEYAFCISLIMSHLSRLSEEIILWSTAEFKYIELDDAFATGSSVMPQKKNPDVAELVRGKTGRAYGNLVALLTVMKGLPLAYNKDMQEDKESLFDSVDTVVNCLVTFTKMLSTVTVLKDNAKLSAEKGYINATDVADYLTKKGVPFRDAYKCSGQLVALCITKDVSLNALPFEYYKQANELFEEDIYQAIDLLTCLNKRTSYGAPSPKMVKGQIEELKKTLASI